MAAVLSNPRSRDRAAMLQRIQRLGPAGRLRAYRAGRLCTTECSLWAAHYPEEVPIVNDELEWIALTLADLD